MASNRRQQILEAYALMLESKPGSRITTAALAAQVGVSEAALYRHFPSKAKMLEGLIEFVEESLFSRISRIIVEEPTAQLRCKKFLWLVLSFSERNPGLARLLVGDALLGENDRLRGRIRQLFDRLETQLRLIMREWAVTRVPGPELGTSAGANLLLSAAEGRINQFVRSEFRALPTAGWNDQWVALERAVFR
ncbi:MAG: nucleoid occlusion factor SlmA [Gammaproteobacteria bacterium]|nr:MAG: nucleoid occlusion factor SlmA [Gammaproteobacteria bacterium]